MMNIEELRKIFCEDGLYAVCVENGNLVSHYRIMCEPPRVSWRVFYL